MAGQAYRKMLPALAIIAAVALFVVALGALLLFVLRLETYGCTPDLATTEIVRFLLPVSLLAGSFYLFRNNACLRLKPVLLAFAAPPLLYGLWILAMKHEAVRDRTCAARTLGEAMTHCGARPEHYRRGRSPSGRPALILVPPGTTDDAWLCLSTWAERNGSVSLEVDDSVYEHVRRETRP